MIDSGPYYPARTPNAIPSNGRTSGMTRAMELLRHRFIDLIYADHNSAPNIALALGALVSGLNDQDIGLNVGAGHSRIHPRIINLDIFRGQTIDCIGRAERLPFADCSFALVMSQETIEHVKDPFLALREMHRVLRPNGLVYCQVPFIIGYHPGPSDYWRFTRQGVTQLIEQAGFKPEYLDLSVGPAFGFHRIMTEFIASSIARFVPSAYLGSKGMAALLLYPIKYLDRILLAGKQADRIAGGYLIIARKTK